MGKKKRASGRRRKPASKTPQQIAEESARRGVPEEQLQGPPARETLYVRSDLGIPRAPDEELRTSQEILERRDRSRWTQAD